MRKLLSILFLFLFVASINAQVGQSRLLEVKEGQIVGLLGPNGAGKTTCFYMIVGIVAADKGAVCIDDENITDLPIHGRAKKGVGYLPQEASIFRKMSVENNILSILETRAELSKAERKQKLEELFRIYVFILALAKNLCSSGCRGILFAIVVLNLFGSDCFCNH